MTLEAGDSAYLNGTTPHTVRCVSERQARMLTVYHGMIEEASPITPADALDDEG